MPNITAWSPLFASQPRDVGLTQMDGLSASHKATFTLVASNLLWDLYEAFHCRLPQKILFKLLDDDAAGVYLTFLSEDDIDGDVDVTV